MVFKEIVINNEKIKVLYANELNDSNKHYKCFCEIDGRLNFAAETEKAIKFKEIQSWLPKSQIRIFQNRLFVKIFIALENNLNIRNSEGRQKDFPFIEKVGTIEVVRGNFSSCLFNLKDKYFQLPNYAIYNNICHYSQQDGSKSVGYSDSTTLNPLFYDGFKSILIPTSQIIANEFGIFVPAWLAQANCLVSFYDYDKKYSAKEPNAYVNEGSFFTRLANTLIFQNYCPALSLTKQIDVA